MKKVVLIAALAAIGLTNTQAQEKETSRGGFEQGDIFISGAVGYGSQKTGENKTTNFVISPRIGFFVSENIAVGAELSYQSTKSEISGTETSDISGFGAGAFGRYYFMPADQFSLFGQLAAGYVSAEDSMNDTKSSGFMAALAPGISYFVSDSFALEATFGILGYSTMEPDGGESTDAFNFGIDMNDIHFGIVYIF